ncbi:hypothetical protein [Hyphomonas sp.]|uniref:YybH family protein n=1 Tax=Hyphomonas sp. TaxID=87 RepID=UPI000C6110C5|nr:hypothetical protein [Hyphomonas sp.]MAU68492.1 hypothetical protein [Hyphomonas sp.]MBM58448.1 hypothetical protein [Hyphomonas sp.]
MTIWKVGLLGAAAMALAGCVVVDERAAPVPAAEVSPPAAMMTEEARAIVEVRNDDFERLFAAGETMELATDLYTIDGRIVPPDAPDQVGAEAIGAYWTAARTVVGSVDLQTVEALPVGEGHITERTHVTLFAPDGTAIGGGKAVILWTLEDGIWKMQWDSWNDGPVD